MRTEMLRLAVTSAMLLACGCASDKASTTPATGTAAAPNSPDLAAPTVVAGAPAAMPTTPPHLTPRADGTYVDAKGNVLVPPPVMIGVTMEQPGPSLVAHLGINPARTSLLVDVIPGLAADNAGLKDHDIVIAVDGSEDASPHNIRARLRKMKPGDAITFTIRRGAESKIVTLTADAWKAEHMVRPVHAGTFNKPGLGVDADSDPAPRELAPIVDRLERIEKQLQQLNRQVGTNPAPAPAAPATAPKSSSKSASTAKPAPQPVPPAAPASGGGTAPMPR